MRLSPRVNTAEQDFHVAPPREPLDAASWISDTAPRAVHDGTSGIQFDDTFRRRG